MSFNSAFYQKLYKKCNTYIKNAYNAIYIAFPFYVSVQILDLGLITMKLPSFICNYVKRNKKYLLFILPDEKILIRIIYKNIFKKMLKINKCSTGYKHMNQTIIIESE